MACTEWTTILVYSQTCEPINFSQTPLPINSRTNTLVNLSTRQLTNLLTCQLVNLSTRQLKKKCQPFSKKFNIKSALSLHQPRTLPQKIDSREGLFWCKIGLVCEWCKMNIYSKETPFTPTFVLFLAKYSAIWRKTQCNMVQNAVRFDAKCSAFWCKTQGKTVQNAVQFDAKCKAKCR